MLLSGATHDRNMAGARALDGQNVARIAALGLEAEAVDRR
jgi:hypothetical protein